MMVWNDEIEYLVECLSVAHATFGDESRWHSFVNQVDGPCVTTTILKVAHGR